MEESGSRMGLVDAPVAWGRAELDGICSIAGIGGSGLDRECLSMPWRGCDCFLFVEGFVGLGGSLSRFRAQGKLTEGIMYTEGWDNG